MWPAESRLKTTFCLSANVRMANLALMKPVSVADPLQPTCPRWRADAAAKARQRSELAALPPAEAQARVTNGLPPGGARVVAGGEDRNRGLLGLAGILAANDW